MTKNSSETVVLTQQRDTRGTRTIWARRLPDGGVVIDGQDLGRGVEEAFGPGLTEYEWGWEVAASDVPILMNALGGRIGDDPIQLLSAWSRENIHRDPGQHLKDAGVPMEFWNRIGD
jgi:hypothetical protein